ncbi:MAG: ATP-dependent Clp protease proteolytic subunit, partial [Bacteroidia bacterium]|nr:ATP-dependent Clp protease proteolytic subunit [Bacteroidia bacterium]
MDLGKEFEKYAVKHVGMSSAGLHAYRNAVENRYTGGFFALTPNIIEERPMNIIAMDVFSRL